MSASSPELALRYLLDLSSDIRVAVMLDGRGQVVALAPETPGGGAGELAAAFVGEVGALRATAGAATVEVDASCEHGTVFVVREGERSMLCVTGRSVLPGLVFHDMHAILADLARAAGQGGRRTGRGSAPSTGRGSAPSTGRGSAHRARRAAAGRRGQA
jgi:hypothetical protein